MGKLADLVGVSRQTVYNELGGKPQLAEAMVMRELDLFLDHVDSAFLEHPDDLVAAIEEAAYRVLDLARTDPLLHAILSSSQGADSELLPLLTTNSEGLLEAAGQVIRSHVARYDVPLEAASHRGAHRHGGAAGAQPRDAADRRACRDRRHRGVDRRARPRRPRRAPRLRAWPRPRPGCCCWARSPSSSRSTATRSGASWCPGAWRTGRTSGPARSTTASRRWPSAASWCATTCATAAARWRSTS